MFLAMNRDRRSFVGAMAMVVATSIPGSLLPLKVELPFEDDLPSLSRASAWLNSRVLRVSDLRGKVVLINFWTYSCINWRRSLPYLRAWDRKYREHGLVVVGVHSPEFRFEQDIENVRRAAKSMMINYPIALDNEYAIWRAFNNEYWPASYFVDAKGHIRCHQFGEGAYDKSERVIHALLAEAGEAGYDRSSASVEPAGPELAADWSDLRSQENYLGRERTENFVSPGEFTTDKPRAFASPARIDLNHWALAGEWSFGKQSVLLHSSNGRIVYRFHARDLHLVMGPAVQARNIHFRILLDGKIPDSAHGADVDPQGYGVVDQARMYQLVRQSKPVEDRTFEIEFFDPALEAYSLTFG